jgi:hypothetical protein
MMDRDKHNTKNLKKCVVGEGCKIHETAKLTNCIVMRNVTVMENAVLEVRTFFTLRSSAVPHSPLSCRTAFCAITRLFAPTAD